MSDAPIRRLFPRPGSVSAAEAMAVAPLAHARGDRPWVVVNMASSTDGRATVGGVSGALGNATDQRLFAALRAQVDCVLVGTGTLAAERYGPIVPDPAARAARVAAGRRPNPLACVVTRSGRLPLDIPLFADPDQPVTVYTPSAAPAPSVRAAMEVVRMDGEGPTFQAALRDLRARHAVGALLCEGGPRVVGALLHEGCVDELFLTFSPLLAGGGKAPTIAEGQRPLPAPAALRLIHVLEDEGLLFLRYLARR